MRYQVNLPLMVLAFRDNHDAAVPLVAGSIIKVLGPADDDRFVIISARGEQFLVFETDLTARASPLEPMSVQKEEALAAAADAV